MLKSEFWTRKTAAKIGKNRPYHSSQFFAQSFGKMLACCRVTEIIPTKIGNFSTKNHMLVDIFIIYMVRTNGYQNIMTRKYGDFT